MRYDRLLGRLNMQAQHAWKHRNLWFLSISTVLAFVVLRSDATANLIIKLNSAGYFGAFFVGMFFSYGITTPIATAVFYLMGQSGLNFIALAMIGGLGALISDFMIFKFVKDVLLADIIEIFREKNISLEWASRLTRHRYVRWMIPVVAGLIIASPLPDEFAAALFGAVRFNPKRFAIISYSLNTLGIFLLLHLGS